MPKQKAGKPAAKAAPLTPWQRWKAQPDAIDTLCRAIAAGDNLNAWTGCIGFPYNTVREWIEADPARAAKYACAREDRADLLADEIVAISDEVDVRTVVNGQSVTLALDAAAIARNRLRVDARKWVASKLKPKAYGEKLDLTHAGEVKVTGIDIRFE